MTRTGGGVVGLQRRGRLAVLRLSGEVDADAVEAFWERVSGVPPAVDRIDSTEVTFLGARGVSLLLAVQARSRDLGYAGHLERPAECVEWILALLGLLSVNGRIVEVRGPVDDGEAPSWSEALPVRNGHGDGRAVVRPAEGGPGAPQHERSLSVEKPQQDVYRG